LNTYAPVPGSTNTASSPNGLWFFTNSMTGRQLFYRGVAINPAP
jgi:hypothetical protein